MLRPIRFIPANLNVDFLGKRKLAFALSGLLITLSVLFTGLMGLNFGIDFRGGILMEVRTEGPADVADMRTRLGGLGLGEVSLQEFGTPQDVLIRIQRQDGEEEDQMTAIRAVQAELGDTVEYRRTEFVGPTVGQELIQAGALAVILAMAGILVYIWLRFEWQFGLCAVVALAHDVISTIGLFALIQHEFNLATVAALLTIAGYSINDTVVVFDRVRENLRRYKKASMIEVLNLSVNQTMARTIMTSVTTLLALIVLYVIGAQVIKDFAFALIWGVAIGTYSTIFVAVPLLLTMKLRPLKETEKAAEGDGPAAADDQRHSQPTG